MSKMYSCAKWQTVGIIASLFASTAAQLPGFGKICGKSELASPPRGWNSYDSSPPWSSSTEASTENSTLRDAAILSRKLKPHGFDILTLDSGWFGEDNKYGTQTIDAYGRLVPNIKQFPSAANGSGFSHVSSQIHSYGLKFGIWIMGGVPRMAVEANSTIKGTSWTAADIAILDLPRNSAGKRAGSHDCPWNRWLVHGINMSHPGAEPYINSLAELYADDWQVDMLKIDCVFGDDWFRGKDYILAMIKALKRRGRSVLISLSPGSRKPDATLASAARAIAQQFQQPIMARLTGDFWDQWPQLQDQFEFAAELAHFSTPLFSPDLDMLPMGWVAHVSPGPRFARLTQQEQRSMVTMWVMARAPLIWGGSPTLSNMSTYSLLSNDAVLGVQTRSCRNQLLNLPNLPKTSTVWAAQSAQDVAGRFVAVFNSASTPATISVPWASLSLSSAPDLVLELWNSSSVTTQQARD